MNELDLAAVGAFIQANIGPQFHDKKLAKIRELTLNTIIKRKNPYVFRAKGSDSAGDYIEAVLDASLSSGEENLGTEGALGICRHARRAWGSVDWWPLSAEPLSSACLDA